MSTPAGTLVPREAQDFGNYQLVAKLATGGMAEIFLARRTDPAGAGALVVIKRILPHLADDEHFVTMFRDEAALASKLEHPNVCRVFSLGQAQGTYYIVMEYLHGVALSRALSRLSKHKQLLDLRVVAGIVIQACEGLHHAHEARAPDGHLLGVVHRDVSPPNIFLGADGLVRLLDFGIAKARGASSKTRTGTVKGKNAYMSPEQILGKPLDRRSDVFALGAVMYELVAVKRLFHRDSDFLTFKAITEEPIPDVRGRRPDLPASFRDIITRALARDVNGRFATAVEMADAVRAAAAPLGGPATPAEIAQLIATDFADELAAKEQLASQTAIASVDADSSQVPTLSASSGQLAAVAPTVVDRPPRGNTLPALGGELSTPTPRPGPPPIPGRLPAVSVETPMPTPPPTPPTGPMAAGPMAMTPITGGALLMPPGGTEPAIDTAAVMARDLGTDLLGERRRAFAIKAIVVVVVAAGIALALVLGGGSSAEPETAVPPTDDPDDVVAATPDARPAVDEDDLDAGISRDDIIAISRFGYFSINATEETVIFVDDVRIGVTPLRRVPLAPGPHKVKAVGPKKKTKKFDITIHGGKDTDWGAIDW